MEIGRVLVQNNIMLRCICAKLGIPESEYKLSVNAMGERLLNQVEILDKLGYSNDDIANILNISTRTVTNKRSKIKSRAEDIEIDFG